MTDSIMPPVIRLLANDVRWGLLKALAESDRQVNELVEQLDQPMNLISYHLRKMRDESLVITRRSEADGRDVYYSLDLARLNQLFNEAGRALHPGIAAAPHPFDAARLLPQRVLFVCTHNSARSQMAEGLLRHLSAGQIEVTSAGSHPTAVHPDAIRTMLRLGIDLRGQRSKSLDDLGKQSFNFVITVCDRAREVCPVFPGPGQQMHWGFADPTAIADDAARAQAFESIARGLKTRIEAFMMTLPTLGSEIGL
jgi:protein-tyrosine-phosphatase